MQSTAQVMVGSAPMQPGGIRGIVGIQIPIGRAFQFQPGRPLLMKSVLLLLLSSWYSAQTATQFVDDLEPMLRANRDQYLAGPHTPVRQQAALAYFDDKWAW